MRAKFPQFKADDAVSLSKLDEAIGLATADMFVHYTSGGSTAPIDDLQPIIHDGAQLRLGETASDPWDPQAEGIARYGGRVVAFKAEDAWGVGVGYLNGYPPRPADGVPGLIWDVDGTSKRALFAPLDGARPFWVSVKHPDTRPAILAGGGPSSGWPAPVKDAVIGSLFVTFYAKALPEAAVKQLKQDEHAFQTCANKAWKGKLSKKLAGMKPPPSDPVTFINREMGALCKANLLAAEKGYVTLIEQRSKDRKALFEKAKARVTSVGADK